MSEALLLSTVNRALVWTPEEIITLHEGQGSYSSATWSEDRIFVSTQNRKFKGEEQKNLLLIFDAALQLVDTKELPSAGPHKVSSIHEIFWWDGKVYMASTGNSRIISWEPPGNMEMVYQSPLREPDKWSRNRGAHLNSVWCNGENFYIVEHMNGPSQVKRFDLDWNWQKTYLIGHQSHNVYVEGDVMYMNTSWYHTVAVRDLHKGGERWVKIGEQLKWKPEKHGEKYTHEAYPRGLARTKEHWYVGLSATLRRGDRDKGSSCVAVFNNDWRLVREIVVPDSGGIGTGGVRVMSETDYAHNRIKCPWEGI